MALVDREGSVTERTGMSGRGMRSSGTRDEALAVIEVIEDEEGCEDISTHDSIVASLEWCWSDLCVVIPSARVRRRAEAAIEGSGCAIDLDSFSRWREPVESRWEGPIECIQWFVMVADSKLAGRDIQLTSRGDHAREGW